MPQNITTSLFYATNADAKRNVWTKAASFGDLLLKLEGNNDLIWSVGVGGAKLDENYYTNLKEQFRAHKTHLLETNPTGCGLTDIEHKFTDRFGNNMAELLKGLSFGLFWSIPEKAKSNVWEGPLTSNTLLKVLKNNKELIWSPGVGGEYNSVQYKSDLAKAVDNFPELEIIRSQLRDRLGNEVKPQ